MNNIIVITTINEPTEAVEKFSKLPGFKLVVVGDKKTPRNWHCSNTVFLGLDSPETAEFWERLALVCQNLFRTRLLIEKPDGVVSLGMLGYKFVQACQFRQP